MQKMIVSGSYDGCVRTGIRIPGYRQGNSAQRMSRLMADTGYLVQGGVVGEWKVESSIDEAPGEVTILSGAFFPGESLDSTILACDAGERGQAGAPAPRARARAEGAILSLARAFAALAGQGKLPRELASCGMMTGEDSALLLPPKIVQLALAKLAPAERSQIVALLRSGKTRDAGSEASFLLAQAAYRLACGVPAWEAEAGAAYPAFARGGFVPSALVQPGLKPALAARVDSSLAEPSAADLPSWLQILSECSEEGWLGKVDAAKAEAAGKLRASSEERLRRENRRAAFFRKRGGILLAAGIALATLGLVVGSVISDRGKRPDFSALGPVALAQTYYRGIDTLDGVLLEVTADRSAYKADDSMVSSMTVLTKMRMAYEQKSPMIAASEWLAKGKPPLESGSILYGITGLEIMEESASGADSVRLRASYTLWTMGAGREGLAPLPESRVTSDELTLKKTARGKKGVLGWKIVDIGRSETGYEAQPAP